MPKNKLTEVFSAEGLFLKHCVTTLRKKINEAEDPSGFWFSFFNLLYLAILISVNSEWYLNSQMPLKARSYALDFWLLQLARQFKKKLSNGGILTVLYGTPTSTTYWSLSWTNFVGVVTHVRILFPWVKPWKILG